MRQSKSTFMHVSLIFALILSYLKYMLVYICVFQLALLCNLISSENEIEYIVHTMVYTYICGAKQFAFISRFMFVASADNLFKYSFRGRSQPNSIVMQNIKLKMQKPMRMYLKKDKKSFVNFLLSWNQWEILTINSLHVLDDLCAQENSL